MTLRIFVNIILFLSIFYLPWWSTIFFILLGTFLFRNFYEGIFAGLLLDLLYGTGVKEFYGVWFVFTASTLIFFVIGERLKKNIRIYESI